MHDTVAMAEMLQVMQADASKGKQSAIAHLQREVQEVPSINCTRITMWGLGIDVVSLTDSAFLFSEVLSCSLLLLAL